LISNREKVHSNGAILLGEQVEVDGYYGRQARIITHFHSDHTKGLSYSARKARSIIATTPTIEALEVLNVKLPKEKIIALEYNTPLNLVGEKVSFLYSKHVFGSAQVLVEKDNGDREGYTSDFKLPGTIIMRDLDTLVIDATYGSPDMTRWFKKEIEGILVDFISSLLSYGYPVTIYAYYGKMQEIMEIIRRYGLAVPFIMPRKVYELTKISVRHGLRINDYFDESTEEAFDIIRSNWFIRFLHYNSRGEHIKSTGMYHVYVTGWVFDKPIKEINYDGWRYIVGFSDHADFEDTLYYVEEANPKNLVIDCTRTTVDVAKRFMKEVKKRKPSINIEISPSAPAKVIPEED